ncbi:MAG: GNAT family N-acetyltransferase [Actinomycetota bacterium]|nr:GNAT family N-acetyltransferase [Actinomycetota bacterium]
MSPGGMNAGGGSLERIETPRLVCERLGPKHRDEIARLVLDPRVARWIEADGRPAPEREVSSWLIAKDEHWARHGFGQWLIRDRLTGEMVGRGGLQHTHVGGREEVEVGWAIVPEHWGQGLATEMALAALELAFGSLGLADVVAFTLPDNIASRGVMEKTGFVFERELEHAGRPHVLYRHRGPVGRPDAGR